MKKSVYRDIGYITPLTTDALVHFEDIVLPQALAGDYEALTRVLFICSQAIEQQCPLSPGLAKFMAAALLDMAEGKDANEAWQVRRKCGQKDTRLSTLQAEDRAFRVAMARQDGMTHEQAVEEVARQTCVSMDTVQSAWKRYRKRIEKHPEGGLIMHPHGHVLDENA